MGNNEMTFGTGLQNDGKYLYFPYFEGGGLDSILFDLELLINIALSMNRIPIINKNRSVAWHRLDNIWESRVIQWDKYLDLSATKILTVESNGTIKEASTPLLYVYEQDFDFNLYSENQIRVVDETQIHDAQNDRYPLIHFMMSKDQRKLGKQLDFLKKITKRPGMYYDSSFFIAFCPSQEVNDLTNIVLNRFGMTQKGAQILSNVLYDIPCLRYNTSLHYKNLNCFACMHVRYAYYGRREEDSIRKPHRLRRVIKKLLKDLYAKNHKSLPLYIMSSVQDTDFFDFLKPHYNIYRYTDFEELRKLFYTRSNIDEILLYMVEKNIFRHATVKVFSWPRNRFIFGCPWPKYRVVY